MILFKYIIFEVIYFKCRLYTDCVQLELYTNNFERYKVEEKLHLGVYAQKRLNTNGLDNMGASTSHNLMGLHGLLQGQLSALHIYIAEDCIDLTFLCTLFPSRAGPDRWEQHRSYRQPALHLTGRPTEIR
jgi:hypothetical protein